MNKIKTLFSILYLCNILLSSGVINLNQNTSINFSTDNSEQIVVDLKIGKIEYSIINKENQDFI